MRVPRDPTLSNSEIISHHDNHLYISSYIVYTLLRLTLTMTLKVMYFF